MSAGRERSILIVLTGSLGDVVRGLPLVDAIKASEPTSKITWLVEDRWQQILSLHPRIDSMIVFERKRGLRGVLAVINALRKKNFDVVLDLQRNLKSGFFNRCVSAPLRVGFHRRDSKEGNWLFQTKRIPYRGDSISKVDHYLLFLQAIDVPLPQKITFGFEELSPEKLAGAFHLSGAAPRVALVLGSSWESKDWFSSGYAKVIEQFREKTTAEIYLLGDSSQAKMAQELLSALGETRLVNYVGKTSLLQLVGILRQASVVIGPDSGPGHISAAVGTPYVTLFGPTDPLRVAPYGMSSLAMRADIGCTPCKRRTCPGLNKLCMRLISPQDVFDRGRAILDSRP